MIVYSKMRSMWTKVGDEEYNPMLDVRKNATCVRTEDEYDAQALEEFFKCIKQYGSGVTAKILRREVN